MKTTRHQFLGTAAGIAGSVAFGTTGSGWAVEGAESAATRVIT